MQVQEDLLPRRDGKWTRNGSPVKPRAVASQDIEMVNLRLMEIAIKYQLEYFIASKAVIFWSEVEQYPLDIQVLVSLGNIWFERSELNSQIFVMVMVSKSILFNSF